MESGTRTALVADIGSCHMGRMDYAKLAIDVAKEIELDYLKFQLFRGWRYRRVGNIEVSLKMFQDLWEYAQEIGQKITASVFDTKSLEFLIGIRPDFIKVAYGKKHKRRWIEKILNADIKCIVSCDVMTEHLVPKECLKLYCVSQYPVPYKIDFEGLFPRFHGFSDHTLGIIQSIEAQRSGALIIEKHMTLDRPDIKCPDHRFALSPRNMKRLKDYTS